MIKLGWPTPFSVSESLQESHMVFVAEPLPSVLSWSVDPEQAGIAELLENFLAGEDLLLLPELPVLVDHLLHHPLRALLQGLLLAVVEVRLEGGGERGPGGGGVDVPGDDSEPGGESSPHPQRNNNAGLDCTARLTPDKDSVRCSEPSLLCSAVQCQCECTLSTRAEK